MSKEAENKTADKTNELTIACVKGLNTQWRNSKAAWVAQGTLIAKYIKETKKSENECFELLTAEPSLLLAKSQIRNLWAVHHLRKNKEIENIDLSLTHFIAVLGNALKTEIKIELLRKAAKNRWSVSDLKNAIEALRPKDPTPRGKTKSEHPCESFAKLLTKLDKSVASISGQSISTQLQSQTLFLIKRFIAAGIITKQRINDSSALLKLAA